MKIKCEKFLKIATSLACCFALVVGLSGCQSNNSDDYAAKVNDKEIKESTVTKYIENIRKNYDLQTEKKWAEYLNSSSMTPSSLRDQILDSMIDQELVKQFASEKECNATQDEINETVQSMKENYSSDDAWNNALTSAGFENEDAYRDTLQYSMNYKKLEDKFKEETELSDETLLEKVPDKLTSLDGAKKSSHILFASTDEEKANEILAKLQSGELDFAQAAKDNSTDTGSASDGGNVGWDKQTSFVTEYQNALDNLNEGDMSGVVKSEYGFHIIKCTGVFHKPETLTSLDQVPSDMLEKIKDDLKSSDATTALTNWTKEKKEASKIEKKDMPNNVSYNVDVEKYKTDEQKSSSSDTSDSSSTEGSSDGSDSSQSTESTESTENTSGGETNSENSDNSTENSEQNASETPAEGSSDNNATENSQ